MRTIAIRSAGSNRILFQGRFTSVKTCVEAAIRDRADLSGADLRHANLANATLDDARLKGARLDHANLSGANLSEAALDGGVLAMAVLYNTCFCFAGLTDCDFTGSQFGATDIAGARLDRARFSTLSAFTLNFRDAATLEDCFYLNETSRKFSSFSKPPVSINGLTLPLVFLDYDVLAGPVTIPLRQTLLN